MSDFIYHYSICLRTPKSPTKKLQKAFEEDEVYLDRDLKACTYGRHLMIPTAEQGERLVKSAAAIIERRYGSEASMVVAYGHDDKNEKNDARFAEDTEIVKRLIEQPSVGSSEKVDESVEEGAA
ncbi:hypothetical protein ACI2KR_09105 [Pseudomonas luteola]